MKESDLMRFKNGSRKFSPYIFQFTVNVYYLYLSGRHSVYSVYIYIYIYIYTRVHAHTHKHNNTSEFKIEVKTSQQVCHSLNDR
jgi:hypothetical protein